MTLRSLINWNYLMVALVRSPSGVNTLITRIIYSILWQAIVNMAIHDVAHSTEPCHLACRYIFVATHVSVENMQHALAGVNPYKSNLSQPHVATKKQKQVVSKIVSSK